MILNNQYRQTDYPPFIAELRGEKQDNVVTYRYLGCEVKYDEPTTGEAELTLRYDAADTKFYSLSRNIMNKQNKTQDTYNDAQLFSSKQNGLRQPNMVLDNIPIKQNEINILWIPPENDKRGIQKKRRLVELRVYKRKSPQNVRHLSLIHI